MFKFNFQNEWLQKYFEHIEAAPTVDIGEKHHIYPECLFGKNSIIKKISIIDHFKAHWLLYKAFKLYNGRDRKQFRQICFALSQFNQVNDTRRKKIQKLNESELEEYMILCAEARQANSDAQKGDMNPAKRPEVREKISKANAGRLKGPRTKESLDRARRTTLERGSQKDLIPVYHVITGEVCKVHVQMVQTLHENWQPGRKFIEKDGTLYWPLDYLKLKDSLRKSEMLSGVKKTKEHSDKINKNPEKIRKSAEKHRGSKRTEEQKQLMSEKRKMYLIQIGGINNKGKKIYHNPDCITEIKQCFPEEQPLGWLLGNPRSKRKTQNESRIC